MNKKHFLIPVIAVSILVLIFGIYNFLSSFNTAFLGVSYNKDYVVTRVAPNSTAEKAGILKGDQLKTYNGQKLSESTPFEKQESYTIGNEVEFTAERNGEAKSFQIILESQFVNAKSNYFVYLVMSLIFLLSGLFVHYKVKSGLSLLYAIFTITVGFLFCAFAIGQNKILIVLYYFCYFFLPALLTHFLLSYPYKSSFLNQKIKSSIYLYLPSTLLSLLYSVLYLLEIDITNNPLNYVLMVIYFGYLLTSLIIIVVKYFRASSEFRQEKGLLLILLATVTGLAVLTLGQLFNEYFILLAVATPVLMSIAILKQTQIELE